MPSDRITGIITDVGDNQVELLTAEGKKVKVRGQRGRSLASLPSEGLIVTLVLAGKVATRWEPPEDPTPLLAQALRLAGVDATIAETITARIGARDLRLLAQGNTDHLRQPEGVGDELWGEMQRACRRYARRAGPLLPALLVQEVAVKLQAALDYQTAYRIYEVLAAAPGLTRDARQQMEALRRDPWLPIKLGLALDSWSEESDLFATLTDLARVYGIESERLMVEGRIAKELWHEVHCGSTYLPRRQLFPRVLSYLTSRSGPGMPRPQAEETLSQALLESYRTRDRELQRQRANCPYISVSSMVDQTTGEEVRSPVFLRSLYWAERDAADGLHAQFLNADALADEPLSVPADAELSEEQRVAAQIVLANGLSLLVGPAGSGKTHVLAACAKAVRKAGGRVALTATTGAAAQRLQMAAGGEATTLHSFIGMVPDVPFAETKKLPAEPIDLLVVDETSMLDTWAAGRFGEWLSKTDKVARVVLCGDDEQLSPVGPGQPLADLLLCLPSQNIARLTENHRSEGRAIAELGQALLRANSGAKTVVETAGDEIQVRVVASAEEVANLAASLGGPQEVSVIAARREGDYSVRRLNEALRRLWNPDAQASDDLASGDRVLQIRNERLEDGRIVWNGTPGVVLAADSKEILLDFQGVGEVSYPRRRLFERIVYGYALTVHRAQGGEYPTVVVVIDDSAEWAKELALVYTAVTRARRRLVLASDQPEHLDAALQAVRGTRRRSLPLHWLEVADKAMDMDAIG